MPALSVIVPVYNNERTLDALGARLAATLDTFDYEVLLINDGSRDGSLARMKALAASSPRFKIISFPRNFGQHRAIAAGLDHVQGDLVILMDADLEDQPEHIGTLIRALEEHRCDIVYTIKGNEAPSSRDHMSNFYHFIFSRMVGVSLPRQLGTYRVFTRKVLEALRQFPERHVLYGPLMFYTGFTHTFVRVERGQRPTRSSYSFTQRLSLAVNSLVTYSDLPPVAFATTGAIMVALPLAYGLLVLLQYAAVGRSLPQGLTLVVLLLCALTGCLMFAIGTLGLYIFRIFQEVLARPRYLIDETVNLSQRLDV